MIELFAKIGPKAKTFTINGETGGKIVGDNIVFAIPSGAFHDTTAMPFNADLDNDGQLDSQLVAGDVQVEVTEFKSAGDMLRGNLPTMSDGGQLLESGGSAIIKAFAGGHEVRISRLQNLTFKNAPVSAENAASMELFVGMKGDGDFTWQRPVAAPPEPNPNCVTAEQCKVDKTCWDQPSCRPFLCNGCGFDVCLGADNCPINPACQIANACKDDQACAASLDCQVKCRGNCDLDECRDVPSCKPAPIAASGMSSDYLFNSAPFGNIGGHNAANCDAISHLSAQHLTLFVRFGSNYSTESGVFFLPTGENTVAKLYTKIPNPPMGQEGYQSYVDAMPIGVAGKLVVVALKDGKYFYEEKPYAIADDGSAGANTATVMANPVEVSEAAFTAAINAL